MFRKNETHHQHSIFGSDQLLPRKYRDRLRGSWAHTFRQDVFAALDEDIFSVLFSAETSRPNAPVNVLFGAEILKAGFGWSDRELADHMAFDLQVRHALGQDDLAGEVPELRTLYNFRRRVREYAEETGVNLFEEAFAQITDRQLGVLEIKTEWQRLDSTQMLSNLAQLKRIELVVAVVQKLWRGLEKSSRERWADRLAPYLEGRPHEICYGIRSSESEEHLERLGAILAEWAEEADLFEDPGRVLLERILREQYELVSEEENRVRLRSPKEISSNSLQSPHDQEATYRFKAGEGYPGGYVAGISETYHPENPLQMITDVQVAPNSTDDATLMERSLDGQSERGHAIEQVVTDGGYNGPTATDVCRRHETEHRATQLRGGRSRKDRLGWEAYRWSFDEAGDPATVACPQGHEVPLKRGRKRDRFTARFSPGMCEGCPLFGNGCRTEPRARGTSFYVTRRSVEVAVARQGLRPEDKAVRAPVEATIRSVKHTFPGGKLPVRGLIRSTMMLVASALMVNARRLHNYRVENGLIELWRLVFWLPRRSFPAGTLLPRSAGKSLAQGSARIAMC